MLKLYEDVKFLSHHLQFLKLFFVFKGIVVYTFNLVETNVPNKHNMCTLKMCNS